MPQFCEVNYDKLGDQAKERIIKRLKTVKESLNGIGQENIIVTGVSTPASITESILLHTIP